MKLENLIIARLVILSSRGSAETIYWRSYSGDHTVVTSQWRQFNGIDHVDRGDQNMIGIRRTLVDKSGGRMRVTFKECELCKKHLDTHTFSKSTLSDFAKWLSVWSTKLEVLADEWSTWASLVSISSAVLVMVYYSRKCYSLAWYWKICKELTWKEK